MSTGVENPPVETARIAQPDAKADVYAGPSLDEATMLKIRRRAALEGCKWDPQVGDVTTLAAFPLVMKRSIWSQLSRWAEQLTAEAFEAEQEIVQRRELLRYLGLPRALQSVLGGEQQLTPAAGRVIRFDFHLTSDGWRISEANSDVPGGFSEASHFTGLMSSQFPHYEPAGNAAAAWADVVAESAGSGGAVAFISAPGYMEDHQVVSFLAMQLRARGCRTYTARPEQILWRHGAAHLNTSWHQGAIDALVRFYQAEWLARLPTKWGWKYFFRGGATPVGNPALAVITESKRFPLVWDKLETRLATWRMLLPETVEPGAVRWTSDDNWLVKSAMCNTGETVSIRRLLTAKQWFQTRLGVAVRPANWVAQRRFSSVPIRTPAGQCHFCVGVYTVNGKAAGAYVRISQKPVIDFSAMDAALLLEDDD